MLRWGSFGLCAGNLKGSSVAVREQDLDLKCWAEKSGGGVGNMGCLHFDPVFNLTIIRTTHEESTLETLLVCFLLGT